MSANSLSDKDLYEALEVIAAILAKSKIYIERYFIESGLLINKSFWVSGIDDDFTNLPPKFKDNGIRTFRL
jgi:hypothetical protein